MMEKLCILLVLCLFGCKQEKFQEFASTLEGLKLNYTQHHSEMETDDELDFYFDFYSISEEEHRLKATAYQESVYKFYHSDKGMIDYLLGFEHSTLYSQWFFNKKSPLSSRLNPGDIMTEPEGALLLIGYFLTGNNRPLNTKQDLSRMTYEAFRSFYAHNQGKTLYQIKKNYKKFRSSLDI